MKSRAASSAALLLLLLAAPASALRIAAFGDSGVRGPEQARVARRLEASQPDLVLLLGDIVYPRGERELYETRFFAYYSALLKRRPFYPAVGNHDYGNAWLAGAGRRAFAQGYVDVFQRPPYYSFDAGPVHFASIDTNGVHAIGAAQSLEPGGAQLRWLDADLAASTAAWKVVFMHIPAYSARRPAESERLRRALEPILAARGVRLVLAGHDHHYARWRSPSGAVHVTAGTGGAPLHRVKRRSAELQASLESHGLLLIDADPRRLRLRFVDAEGAEKDALELSKE